MEVWVEDVDYLRILEEGNFINFVVMVIRKPDQLSVVKTSDLRLKVSYVRNWSKHSELQCTDPHMQDVCMRVCVVCFYK